MLRCLILWLENVIEIDFVSSSSYTWQINLARDKTHYILKILGFRPSNFTVTRSRNKRHLSSIVGSRQIDSGASLLRNYAFYKSLQLLVLFMTQYRHLSNGNCLVWMFYLCRSFLIQSSANLEPRLTFISTFTISKESLGVEVELSWKCSVVKTTIEPPLFVSDYFFQPLVIT